MHEPGPVEGTPSHRRLSPASAALLERAVEASRTLGSDPSLVLHGGGNTSIKLPWTDVDGTDVDAIFVKGSGADLADITAAGFTPMRLDLLRRLLPPTELDPDDLPDQLACAVLDSGAPSASVETLVHVALPHACVWHSHADALLALTNTTNGEGRVRESLGERVLVIEYAMPGPELGAAVARAWADAADRHDTLEGIVVLQHGLFTFGDTPEQALERHHDIVAAVSTALPEGLAADAAELAEVDPVAIAQLRSAISDRAGMPVVMRREASGAAAAAVGSSRLVEAMRRGPVTPDHANWTGPEPMVGRDLDAYGARLAHRRNASARGGVASGTAADEDWPKVVLDRDWGVLTAGRTAKESVKAWDITRHTIATASIAEALGGYAPAAPAHCDMLRLWAPQAAKKTRATAEAPLRGRVALVTGAASGIGRACAEALLDAGACVVGWDLSDSVAATFDGPEWLGLQVDVTDAYAQRAAIAAGVDAFGGIDIVVVSAGIFPTAQHLTDLDPGMWRKTMAVNVDAVAILYGLVQPFLALAPGGGNVVVIASKNVAAPGPGAAAYSSSKAALTQLSRVAALEWAPAGIRVNMVHPDAVFDTALWTPELLEKRAKHYGMTVDEYKRRNLLSTEVTSKHVGRMVCAMADGTFASTTGAQVPIDGGNERVI